MLLMVATVEAATASTVPEESPTLLMFPVAQGLPDYALHGAGGAVVAHSPLHSSALGERSLVGRMVGLAAAARVGPIVHPLANEARSRAPPYTPHIYARPQLHPAARHLRHQSVLRRQSFLS